MYEAELSDRAAQEVLQLLSDVYGMPGDPWPMAGAATRLTVDLLLEGPPADDGHRIAEATRLLGVALQRLEGGEARGTVTDRTGQRRMSWSLVRPMPARRAAE